MAEARSHQQRTAARGNRCKRSPKRVPVIRTVSRSYFTTQPYNDAWILDEGDGILTLNVGDGCLALIHALPLDQPSLNRLLEQLRHRPPMSRR